MNKNTVPNIWTAQENHIHLYKMICVTLGLVVACLAIFMAINAYQNPIVVVKTSDRHEFYPTVRQITALGKPEVEEFSRRFLEAIYVWSDFQNGDTIRLEMGPFADHSLVVKFVEALNQKFGKDMKGKKLAQAITFVKVNVLEDRIVCNFDRILKIDGVPLVIPSETTLTVVQGAPTRLNPMGIYVSGISEHEGAK